MPEATAGDQRPTGDVFQSLTRPGQEAVRSELSKYLPKEVPTEALTAVEVRDAFRKYTLERAVTSGRMKQESLREVINILEQKVDNQDAEKLRGLLEAEVRYVSELIESERLRDFTNKVVIDMQLRSPEHQAKVEKEKKQAEERVKEYEEAQKFDNVRKVLQYPLLATGVVGLLAAGNPVSAALLGGITLVSGIQDFLKWWRKGKKEEETQQEEQPQTLKFPQKEGDEQIEKKRNAA